VNRTLLLVDDDNDAVTLLGRYGAQRDWHVMEAMMGRPRWSPSGALEKICGDRAGRPLSWRGSKATPRPAPSRPFSGPASQLESKPRSIGV
jgi:hypothetical protein